MAPLALAAVLIAPSGLTAAAQTAAPPSVPLPPPPLRLVCAIGPQSSDFCPAKPRARSGAACVCARKDSVRHGRVELR